MIKKEGGFHWFANDKDENLGLKNQVTGEQECKIAKYILANPNFCTKGETLGLRFLLRRVIGCTLNWIIIYCQTFDIFFACTVCICNLSGLH
jgi:hypothetical protein